ncbi:MAG: MFS transporter [Gammaproteobacteria bacterium]|nr:MFS transporter [Gammaproteobacteria bacterium]
MSEANKPGRGAVLTLLSRPDYFRMWLIGGLTGIVRWLQLLVLGIYTFEITGSPLLVSLVPVCWMLPLALCGPFIGVLADRINRKVLLCVAMTLIMTVSIGMAILASVDTITFGHIAVVSLLSGIFWTTDMPVRRRLMGDLSEGALSTAMSLDSATGNATRMFGPLMGGVMLQSFSLSGVFVLSGLVYAVCLVLALVTRLPHRQTPTVSSAFVRDLVAGLRFVRGDKRLRRIFAVTIVFNIWGFPFTSMVPVFGKDRLGLDPFYVGLLSSMEGFGAFIGALMVAVFATPALFFRIYVGGTMLYLGMIGYLSVLAFVAGGPLHSYLAASVSLVVIGTAGACFAAMQSTLTYLSAPPELRSRVLGVLTLCIGTGPIGFFNVGWMAELYGVSAALAIISIEGLVVLAALWAYGADVRIDASTLGAITPSQEPAKESSEAR